MTERAYLDWNASALLRPRARAAMLAALDISGNPSSVHGEGRAARNLIETARAQVAVLAGAQPEQVIFTSGATEANAMALSPGWARPQGEPVPARLLLSAVPNPHAGLAKRVVEARGEVPSQIDSPPGCPFVARCPHPMTACRETMPGVTARISA